MDRIFKTVSLRVVILLPFVALAVFAVALVGYISYRNGQEAVNNVALQLRLEINARIAEHLQKYLDSAQRINQVNADMMSRGMLDAADQVALEKHFWEQVQFFENVTSINFSNTAGGLANAGREGAEGLLYVIYTEDFVAGPFYKYATDAFGNRTELLDTLPEFDGRQRSWYRDAVEQETDIWSEIYILFTGQDMSFSASRPVYDTRDRLLGVIAVNLFLGHLGDFLVGLDVGYSGQSFIMERSGLLVASSEDERPFITLSDSPGERIGAINSDNAMTRAAAASLQTGFGDYRAIDGPSQFDFILAGVRHFGQVTPFQDRYGLDWLIVTVIPETDFMAQVHANNRITIFLICITLIVVVLVTVFVTGKILRPIDKLNDSAGALALGQWEQTVPTGSRIREIGALTDSFNFMAAQMREMVMGLTREVEERKKAEYELALLNDQLAMKNREMERYVYIASHDLRSPLVNIEGYSRELALAVDELKQIFKQDAASPEPCRVAAGRPIEDIDEALGYIRSSGTQMNQLITGLLKLSRSGRAPLEIEDLDMNKLVKGVVASLEYRIRETASVLNVGELPPCRGDYLQVGQIFANILNNALNYLAEERPGVITVTGRTEGERSIYCLEDNGIGIDAAQQEKVFEVFQRLDPAAVEGEGLGLTIVRQILDRLDGEVRLESTPGQGSRFYIILPRAEPEGK